MTLEKNEWEKRTAAEFQINNKPRFHRGSAEGTAVADAVGGLDM